MTRAPGSPTRLSWISPTSLTESDISGMQELLSREALIPEGATLFMIEDINSVQLEDAYKTVADHIIRSSTSPRDFLKPDDRTRLLDLSVNGQLEDMDNAQIYAWLREVSPDQMSESLVVEQFIEAYSQETA